MTTPEMPLYQGTKQLRARPMKKSEYCAYRGWTVPANEDPAETGYLVEYQDGGKPNDDRHQGYISWSPADVFERTYRPSESFIDRLEIELGQVRERHTKLAQFLGSPEAGALPSLPWQLLVIQGDAMQTYLSVLGARLEFARETTPPVNDSEPEQQAA